MLTQFINSGCLALALVLTSGAIQPLMAQHHSHHHHHSGFGGGYYGGSNSYHGSGIRVGGIGISIGYGGLGYGNSYGYSGYGYGNSLYGGSYSNSYPSYGYSNFGYGGTNVYVVPRDVTPQIVTPVYVTPRYVTSTPVYPTPSVVYRTPRVQSTSRISTPPPDDGQRTNLPGVSLGGRAHIPELAGAVADRTNQLCVALSDSYRDSPQFKEIYRDIYSLITRSQQVDTLHRAGDSQGLMTILTDMNAILTQATPVIESWQPARGDAASATSHLSSVQSALNLLSIDAGWDASQADSPAPSSAPGAAPARVAPAPESLPLSIEPTPVDPVPAP